MVLLHMMVSKHILCEVNTFLEINIEITRKDIFFYLLVKQEDCSIAASSCSKLESCTNEETEDICLNDCAHDLNAACYEKISQSVLTQCSCMDVDGEIIV